MATEITPDTDELLLREIEAALTAARKAFDASQWDEAALRLGVVFQQSFRLIGYLRPRLAQQGPNVGDLA